MACAVCGDKHTFDNCKFLLDVDFLRKHFIAYCLQWKRTHQQMTTAGNQLRSADVTADTDDQDTVSDDSDTATDDNDDKLDFPQEGK